MVSEIPALDGKNDNLFYSVDLGEISEIWAGGGYRTAHRSRYSMYMVSVRMCLLIKQMIFLRVQTTMVAAVGPLIITPLFGPILLTNSKILMTIWLSLHVHKLIIILTFCS